MKITDHAASFLGFFFYVIAREHVLYPALIQSDNHGHRGLRRCSVVRDVSHSAAFVRIRQE